MAEPATTTPSRGEVPCTYHPDVQTGLRCTRCGKPICPKCAVRTPVGLRCPDCAGVRGLRTIRTTPASLLRAGAAATIVGVVTVVLWYFLPEWKFYLSLLLGFGVAESIAKVVNGKRGADLQILGIAVVTVALIAVRVLLALKYGLGLDDLTSSEMFRVIDGGRVEFGTPRDFLQLTFVPDLLFMAMVYAIVWVRFR